MWLKVFPTRKYNGELLSGQKGYSQFIQRHFTTTKTCQTGQGGNHTKNPFLKCTG